MSASARESTYRHILEKCDIATAVVGHEVIDRLNIFEASLLAMGKAIRGLHKKPDCVLVDGPRAPQAETKLFTVIDGDALSFSVACASIVAKVTRDRLMETYDRVYPQYGFGKHKGYGTARHLEALEKYGPCPIHRKSFGPVRKLLR